VVVFSGANAALVKFGSSSHAVVVVVVVVWPRWWVVDSELRVLLLSNPTEQAAAMQRKVDRVSRFPATDSSRDELTHVGGR
jgi:hypothetical protein